MRFFLLCSLFCITAHGATIKNRKDCSREEASLLNRLGLMFDWRGPLGRQDFYLKSPTAKFGRWIQYSGNREGRSLTLVSNSGATEFSFDSECRAQVKLRKSKLPASNPKAFVNDAALAAFLGKHKAGAIVIWSPRMPHSVETLKNFERLSKERTFSLLVLLDNNLGASEVVDAKRRFRFPASYFQQYQSVEIGYRDVGLHFPAVLAFKNSRISREPHFGHAPSDQQMARLKSDWSVLDAHR